MRELLNEPAEPLEPVTRVERFRGDVSFDRVGFAYPSRPEVEVLKGLSFSVEAGKIVALVGPSGAGKSTIAALLLRFYDPQQGRIVFDGRAATDYGLHELRSQMALVPQEVLLFGGSIAENIGLRKTRRHAGGNRKRRTPCQCARIHRGISRGLQDARGVSGASRFPAASAQRIAIARALLKDPSILILDEATSALDAGKRAARPAGRSKN